MLCCCCGAAILVYFSVRDWTRICYVIGFEKKSPDSLIHTLSDSLRIYFCLHWRADLKISGLAVADSPDARGGKLYPEWKSCGLKNIRTCVDGTWTPVWPRQRERQQTKGLLSKAKLCTCGFGSLYISLAFSAKQLAFLGRRRTRWRRLIFIFPFGIERCFCISLAWARFQSHWHISQILSPLQKFQHTLYKSFVWSECRTKSNKKIKDTLSLCRGERAGREGHDFLEFSGNYRKLIKSSLSLLNVNKFKMIYGENLSNQHRMM